MSFDVQKSIKTHHWQHINPSPKASRRRLGEASQLFTPLETRHKCPIKGCSYQLPSKAFLKDHLIQNHTQNLKSIQKQPWISINLYKCGSCENIFLTENSLKRHTIINHMPKLTERELKFIKTPHASKNS